MQDLLLYLLLGAVTCTIGAVPLGLVNLSVVDEAVNTTVRKSMAIAFGAAFIEILFALAALFAGAALDNTLSGSLVVKGFVFAILLLAGLWFLLKKNKPIQIKNGLQSYAFVKGAFLNLISIQVLLFWMIAITILSVRNILPDSKGQVILFISGVWLAKIMVLRAYAILAKRVLAKSKTISKQINLIIGIILILAAIFQLLRFGV